MHDHQLERLNNDLFISRRILTKKNKVGNENADGNGAAKS